MTKFFGGCLPLRHQSLLNLLAGKGDLREKKNEPFAERFVDGRHCPRVRQRIERHHIDACPPPDGARRPRSRRMQVFRYGFRNIDRWIE